MPQWSYRPTNEEHEALLRVLAKHPEYPSAAQFIREAVIRMIHSDDKTKLFTEVGGLIEELQGLKEKFLRLVLKASEGGSEEPWA